jgi:mRNA interferase MazF
MKQTKKLAEAGEIVIVDFPGAIGIKRRPAVIVSSALYHRQRPDVILGVVTSQIGSATATTDCLLQDWAVAGLRRPSAFRAFLATVPRSTITARVGRLEKSDWQAVRERIRVALA